MRDLLLNKIIPDLLYTIITIFIGLVTYYTKQFWLKHKDFLELQRQQLIQKIGIDKYNQDVATVKSVVMAVEQLGKELSWEGIVKHQKVLEMIEGKTGLKDEEIFSIIKSTVGMINAEKANV